jgi:predicted TIM-barrel fold metal-dependent hydrolase
VACGCAPDINGVVMATIDMHVHLPVPEWLEGALGPYLESAERFFHTKVTARPMEDLAAEYEELDMVGVLLAWDAETATRRPPLSNDLVAGVVKRFPGRFLGFGSVDPYRPDAAERVRRLTDLGLVGLKLHPTMQGFDPSGDLAMRLFEAAATARLVVITHTGTSGLGAGCPGGQGLRIDLARPILLDRAAAAFPEMPIVLAHIGWPWHLEALAMALHKSNIYIDISGWRYRYLPPEALRDMKGRLSGQFLFGTDVPMFCPAELLKDFAGLDLPEGAAAKILSENASRLLRLKG